MSDCPTYQSIMKPAQPRKILSVGEVATALRIHRQHVLDLIEGGELNAVNIGDGKRKHWRIAVEEFDRFVRSRSSLENPEGTKR